MKTQNKPTWQKAAFVILEARRVPVADCPREFECGWNLPAALDPTRK